MFFELPTTLASRVGYATGGLGQVFAQVVEEVRAARSLARYYAPRIKPGDEEIGRKLEDTIAPLLFRYTPLRFSLSWREFLGGRLYDRLVAKRLEADTKCFIGLQGQALLSLGRARQLGAEQLGLIASTPHITHVAAQHAKAQQFCPVEEDWLNPTLLRAVLAEYALADMIYTHSEYTHQSFLAAGIPSSKLHRIHLRVDPRFSKAEARADEGVFRVVYTGIVTSHKGVPMLLEAFARLSMPDAELILVGGTGTRGMRRYVEDWQRRDPRIRLAPGDPLPWLRKASVYVHASFQDGFSFGAMEALACGVPVIVSEDTGMKEHVRDGRNGYIVPTGDVDALHARLEDVARHRLAGGS